MLLPHKYAEKNHYFQSFSQEQEKLQKEALHTRQIVFVAFTIVMNYWK
jgi:hypothetical protein